jgi:hypothetical protein
VKSGRPRANNVPADEPETDLEAQLLESGRGHMVPHQGVIGAHADQPGYSTEGKSDAEGQEPVGNGGETAPTDLAARREQERHRLERELGRVGAGQDGVIRDTRTPGVTREKLDAAAREADRRIIGHEIAQQK